MSELLASSRPLDVRKAQDVHGALLARLQAQALGGGPDSVARLPVALREAAWVEAGDCFTAMLPGQEVRLCACDSPRQGGCAARGTGRQLTFVVSMLPAGAYAHFRSTCCAGGKACILIYEE